MLKRFKPKSEFSRNVLTLMTGTTIAQAIPIAISPILTRLYTPEDFGVFALYMSVASLISVVATGRYELAIMLPKKDEDALNIVVLSISISFLVSFISFLIVYFFNAFVVSLLGHPEISKWLYLIPVTVFLTGIYQSFNYWNNRKKRYKKLAASKIFQSSTMGASNLAMGFGGLGAGGLILGTLVGTGVASSILGSAMWKKERNRLWKDVEKSKMRRMMKQYVKFPLFNLPNAFIDNVRVSGINILISKFFSTSILGQFSLAWKMVQMPFGLVAGALSQVFYQKIAEAPKNDLNRILKKYIFKASSIALPIFFLLYLFSIDIFTVIFGKNWEVAGKIASIITPWLFLNFISSPIAYIFIVLNKQDILFWISIVYMVVPLGILFFFHEHGFIYVLQLITVSMSTVLLFYIIFSLLYTKRIK